MPGKVYIVGAGPGAADLLTVRAAAVLRAARLVLHDDLVPDEILALAPESAELINVGKRCGRHGSSQEQINRLMTSRAEAGVEVVRLKSGDPAVFGRLGEELQALREAGIPFEIVPGVTAATASAAAAGITLTDRRAASTLVVTTAHTCTGEPFTTNLFNPQRATFAIYMPGPDYGRTARELLHLGLPPETPCALIGNAGRPQEQTKYLTLLELVSAAAVPAPVLLLVGEVTRHSLPEETKGYEVERGLAVHHQPSPEGSFAGD